MNFEIPPGLTDLLQDFTVAVLRERPPELVQFAADYFNKLNESKNADKYQKRGGVRFVDSPVAESPITSEPMQTDDEDDDEPMVPPPSRYNSRRKSVSGERYDPEADAELGEEEKLVYPKSDEQRQRLGEAVKDILLFRSLDPEQMQEVLDAMFERQAEPDEHIIDQGDDGDNFYVIDSGKYDIYVLIEGKPTLVGNYDSKGSFGELALMYNMPRAATIIATTHGTLWALDRRTFQRIVLKSAYLKRKMYENLLESVPMLKSLNAYERMNVADALHSVTYEDGDVIIRQGDNADCMFFLQEGEVRFTVKNDANEEKEVNRCKTGGYFGELALVTHKPRAATAYAVGKTKVAVLAVDAFERLMGPCMDIMSRNIDEYEEQLVQVFGSKANISDLR